VQRMEARVQKKKEKEGKQAVKSNVKDGARKSKGKDKSAVDRTPCGTCGDRFCDDDSGRSWIQCQQPSCLKWYHNSCQGIEEKGQVSFFASAAMTVISN